MASSPSRGPGKLSQLQLDFLKTWFLASRDFFLTGGGALVGFYNAPRTTRDVDLFTVSSAAFQSAPGLVHDCALSLGGVLTAMQTSPHFRRYRIERGTETTLVDLVEDLAPQIRGDKLERDGFILDPPEEIAVNKVCAIVSRSEARDFFDLHYLTTIGFDADSALRVANDKDGGVDRESMVMVLQSINWEHFKIAGLESGETAAFFKGWLKRLTISLLPDP